MEQAKVSHRVPVYKTKEYDQFSYHPLNRAISEGNVRKIMKSVQKKNLLEDRPALINDDFIILDGQHRFEVCKRLGIDFYFQLESETDKKKKMTIQEIALLQNSMGWQVKDWVESYAKKGIRDYVILLDFHKKHKLPLTTCAKILAGVYNTISSRNTIKGLDEGKFRVKDLRNADKFATRINEIFALKKLPKSLGDARHFFRALNAFYEHGADHALLLEKISKYPYPIERKGGVQEYLTMIQNIYNYNQKKNRLDVYEKLWKQ